MECRDSVIVAYFHIYFMGFDEFIMNNTHLPLCYSHSRSITGQLSLYPCFALERACQWCISITVEPENRTWALQRSSLAC